MYPDVQQLRVILGIFLQRAFISFSQVYNRRMLRAEQRAIVLPILRRIKSCFALLDHGAYRMEILFAAGMSAAMEHFALLTTNTANLLALSVPKILNDGAGVDGLRNTSTFETGPDVAKQTRADAVNPTRVLAAALEEAAPTRAEHAFYRPQRLLLHTQHASPHTIFNATII